MIIGIDMGGTKIEAGVVNNKGKVIQSARVLTEAEKGKEQIISKLKKIISELSQKRKIDAIGVGIPGVSDGKRIKYLTNIPCLNGVNLKKELSVKIPFVMENDAACFVLAESKYGCKSKNVFGVTLGTGLGSATIINGTIHKGSHSYAGETSYSIFNPEEYSRGQKPVVWENVLSGEAFTKTHKKYSGKELHPGQIWKLSSEPAEKTLELVSRNLAVFLTNACLLLDPEYVVVGGGASSSKLLKSTKKHMKELLSNQEMPKLVSAKVSQAGVVGAAEVARREIN